MLRQLRLLNRMLRRRHSKLLPVPSPKRQLELLRRTLTISLAK